MISQTSGSSPASQWEYSIVEFSDTPRQKSHSQNMLNELGLQGWELVAVTKANDYSETSFLFLKRRR